MSDKNIEILLTMTVTRERSMKINYSIVTAIIAAIVLLSGCATQQPQPTVTEPGAEGQPADTDFDSPSSTIPLGSEGNLSLDSLNDPNNPLSVRIIYFDYDSSEVTPESLDIITTHGQFVASNQVRKIRLEGHADERGSREYNLGLGERRAQSIQQLLKLQGVSANQIEIISYGEEMPSAFGHDESSWQLNRRVELVYIDQ